MAPTYRTGNPTLDDLVSQLLEAATGGTDRRDNRDQLRRILTTAVLMMTDGADRLDLKIASAALEEMRDAYKTFSPFRERRKVTIFGSARTAPSDPLYAATRELAARLAARGWMVVTGAGPGIMSAGLEGAGRENALGVTIRLPFESTATDLVDNEQLVEMKYFFTRKLALIRESDAFVAMPGGFGTLDESFELLTLMQTGKAEPVPVVMLGLGQGYWSAWQQFVDVVIEQGWVSDADRKLYLITNDIDEAVDEIVGFYANFHSLRYAGDDLIVRLVHPPSATDLARLSADFADLLQSGSITATAPIPGEIADNDHLALARVRLTPHRRKPGRLRELIDAMNQLPSG